MSATSRVKQYVRGAKRELPWESAMAVLAAATALVLVDGNPLGKEVSRASARLLLAAIVAAPALFTATVLLRSGRIGRTARHAISGGLVAGCGALLLSVSEASLGADWFAWSYGLALLAFTLTPFAAVAVAAAPEDRFAVFASFARRFAEATTAFALLGSAAAAAMAVVFAAIGGLFEVKVALLAVRCGIFMTAGFAIAYLFELLPQPRDEQTTVVPDIWRKLVTAVGAPFTATMIAILSTYEVWVLATGRVPKNLLSPLIIGAGAVGLFCALIVQSILLHEHNRGDDRLSPAARRAWERVPSIRIVRALPAAILALLPMAGWAVYVRVEQYGFTPFRVVRAMALGSLLVIGAWGTLRWVRGRVPLSWQVPAIAALFAAVTAVGPLSARNLSIASQSARLEALLQQHGVTARDVGSVPPASPAIELTRDEYDEVRDRASALISYGALDTVLPGASDTCPRRWDADACLARLSLHQPDTALEPAAASRVWGIPGPVRTRFGTLHRSFHVWNGSPVHRGRYSFALRGMSIIVSRNDAEVARIDVPTSRPDGELPAGAAGLFIPTRVEWQETETGPELVSVDGQWLEFGEARSTE